MSSQEPYDPQYIEDIAELPTRGPRKNSAGAMLFDEETRRLAARKGERRLELDVNEGEVIILSSPFFADAAAEWASYMLLSGTLPASGVPLEAGGDASAQRQNLAELCREDYRDMIAKIIEHGLAETTEPEEPKPREPVDLRIDRI